MCKNFEAQGLLIPQYAYDIYNSELKAITKESAFILLSKIEFFENYNDLSQAFDWATNCPKDNVDFWFKIYQSLYN